MRKSLPVMNDAERFPGRHLHFPTRRQTSPAFRRLLEALRYPA